MVYGTFNISGAQLNPAVTFALTLLGKKCLDNEQKKNGWVCFGGLGWFRLVGETVGLGLVELVLGLKLRLEVGGLLEVGPVRWFDNRLEPESWI